MCFRDEKVQTFGCAQNCGHVFWKLRCKHCGISLDDAIEWRETGRNPNVLAGDRLAIRKEH